MPELRMTVVTPNLEPQEEAKELDGLMSLLASEAGRVSVLQRQAGFGQPDGPLRVFIATFSTADALAALLRACGGWYMRHPSATVTLKVESGKGGKTLQLKKYSPVALANAAAQLEEYLE
ncbi:MAG: hypothetical protein ABR575_05075 [Actinomycetota bacterium]